MEPLSDSGRHRKGSLGGVIPYATYRVSVCDTFRHQVMFMITKHIASIDVI